MPNNSKDRPADPLVRGSILRVKTVQESLSSQSQTITTRKRRRRRRRINGCHKEDDENDKDNGQNDDNGELDGPNEELGRQQQQQQPEQQHTIGSNSSSNTDKMKNNPTTTTELGQKNHDSSSHSSTSTTSSAASTSTVRFDKVQIREYTITIGDNPCCSSGPPLSLDWRYNTTHEDATVDSFESTRAGLRRMKSQMMIPASVRHNMLRNEWDVSMNDIIKATKEIAAIQNHRHKSAKWSQRMARLEEYIEQVRLAFCLCSK